MFVSIEVFVGFSGDLLEDEEGDNKAIDSQNTSHDNWDDGFEDELRLEDSHGGDSDSGLGGSVGSSQVFLR